MIAGIIMLTLLSCIIFGLLYIKWYRNNEINHLLQDINEVVDAYPLLPESYAFTRCHYWDGSTEYVMINTRETTITATRTDDGQIVCYHEGMAWKVDAESGEAIAFEGEMVDIPALITDKITEIWHAEIDSCHYWTRTDALPIPAVPTHLFCFTIDRQGSEEVASRMDDMSFLWSILSEVHDHDHVSYPFFSVYLVADKILPSEGDLARFLEKPNWDNIPREMIELFLNDSHMRYCKE